MAATSRKRAALVDFLPQCKKQKSLTIHEDEAWQPQPDDGEGDVDSPAASTASSPRPTPRTSRSHSVADTSLTSASSGIRAKVFFCEYEGCGKAFDRPIRLQMHINSHTNERPYACAEEGCKKSFFRNEHLQAHIKAKHNDERSYLCTYVLQHPDGTEEKCDKSFHTGTRLRRHVAMHEEKEQTRCQDCGKEFRKQETLQRHIKSVHLDEKAYRCAHVDDEAMMNGEAEECGQTFANPRQLKAHMTRDHSGQRYFCEICSPNDMNDNGDSMSTSSPAISFSTYLDLQTHMKTIHPPTCTDCGQPCESNRALKAHMDIYHSALSERQHFACDYPGCDRRFTKKGNMKVHVQTVHTKARQFTCGEHDLSKSNKVDGWDNARGCGHSFGTKANLEEHIRTQHLHLLGSYRASRSVKSRSGASTPAGLLTGHGYADDRPIACLITDCANRFMRNYDLATHLELQHGWNVDDVNDRMAEKEALEGGKFWIGGGELLEEQADRELRVQLTRAMQLHGQGQDARFEGMPMTGGAGPVVEQDEMAIDPALMDS